MARKPDLGETLPLFPDLPPDPEPTRLPLSHRDDPEVSRKAAKNTQGTAARHRAVILKLLAAYPGGLTADDIEATFGWRTATAGKRLSEMARETPPRVRVALDPEGRPRTHKTRTGSLAQVYVLAADPPPRTGPVELANALRGMDTDRSGDCPTCGVGHGDHDPRCPGAGGPRG